MECGGVSGVKTLEPALNIKHSSRTPSPMMTSIINLFQSFNFFSFKLRNYNLEKQNSWPVVLDCFIRCTQSSGQWVYVQKFICTYPLKIEHIHLSAPCSMFTHIYLLSALHIHTHPHPFHEHLCLICFKSAVIIFFPFQTGSCHPVERKSRRCWKYLFCFAEPDFTPRQGHQHSAFVTAELQQASLVCGGEVGEAVWALLGGAGGGARGRLKSFHPLLALPCGHEQEWVSETEKKTGRRSVWMQVWGCDRVKTRGKEIKQS